MEVLVARMKAFSNEIRFIAVSATIPNASDFALWIGKRENQPQEMGTVEVEDQNDAAQLYTFSEAFRPCPLKKVSPISQPRIWKHCFRLSFFLPGSTFMDTEMQKRIHGHLTEISTQSELSHNLETRLR